MKTNRLLVAVVLAIAIGAPIADFGEGMSADDIFTGTDLPPRKFLVNPDWLLLSRRTSGSIRRL